MADRHSGDLPDVTDLYGRLAADAVRIRTLEDALRPFAEHDRAQCLACGGLVPTCKYETARRALEGE